MDIGLFTPLARHSEDYVARTRTGHFRIKKSKWGRLYHRDFFVFFLLSPRNTFPVIMGPLQLHNMAEDVEMHRWDSAQFSMQNCFPLAVVIHTYHSFSLLLLDDDELVSIYCNNGLVERRFYFEHYVFGIEKIAVQNDTLVITSDGGQTCVVDPREMRPVE